MNDRSKPWADLTRQVYEDHQSLGVRSMGVEIVALPGGGLACLYPKGSSAITKADR